MAKGVLYLLVSVWVSSVSSAPQTLTQAPVSPFDAYVLASAQVCLGCHQRNIQPSASEGMPVLPLAQADLINQLLSYKRQPNSGTLMPRIARGYSDEELIAIAQYLRPEVSHD